MAVWFGWRSIFWLIASVALLVIIAITIKIPETLAKQNRQRFNIRSVMSNYHSIFFSRDAMLLMLTGGFSFAGMFAFLTAGSFVYIELHGVSTERVGFLFALNVLSMMVMTTLNGRIVRRQGSRWMLKMGLSIQLLGATLLLLGQIFDLGLWAVVIPVMMFISAISTVGSNTMAILLNEYGTIAGTASSLSGTLRFGLGACCAAIISFSPATTSWPMVTVICGCAVMSSLCFVLRTAFKTKPLS
ncbi:MFS transporter [Psychromonas sp. KJ10-10]|uniref:MFS transporter n=1 Tax=Psychromonas sp. KJ10-10 TaxID=3391823 RepID=UPI0039B475CF